MAVGTHLRPPQATCSQAGGCFLVSQLHTGNSMTFIGDVHEIAVIA
jgi:hypothetical protein